jgi:hypothetical protein
VTGHRAYAVTAMQHIIKLIDPLQPSATGSAALIGCRLQRVPQNAPRSVLLEDTHLLLSKPAAYAAQQHHGDAATLWSPSALLLILLLLLLLLAAGKALNACCVIV